MIPSTQRIPIREGDVDTWDVDWADWLAAKTEEYGSEVTIATSVWTSSDPEIVAVLDDPPPALFGTDDTTARAWWEALGTATNEATVTNTITTSAGHVRSEAVVFVIVAP